MAVYVRFKPQNPEQIDYPGGIQLYRNATLYPDGYVYAEYVGDVDPAALGLEVIPEIPSYEQVMLQITQQIKPKTLDILLYDPNDTNKTPKLFYTIDPTTGETQVAAELTILDEQGNIDTTFNTTLLVPIVSALDGRLKREVAIDIGNGQGSKTLTFTQHQTGRYGVRIADILNLTNQKPLIKEGLWRITFAGQPIDILKEQQEYPVALFIAE